MSSPNLARDDRSRLRAAWTAELDAARAARTTGDSGAEWTHLERAHILSQPMAGAHVRTHLAMFASAWRRHDRHEVVGQLFRMVVAAPGSATGKYPIGNTGGANVSAFAPMPIPDDLRDLLGDPVRSEVPDMADDVFSTDTAGLTEAVPTSAVRLGDGDRLDLRISPVTKRVGDDELRMLAYNGSIPGPTLHVDQGSELTVEVRNEGDIEATVHWHGLRVENRFDGVPFETQDPIPVGASYVQHIKFPDAGVYWYHPHIREDYGLELGLYGTVIVEPSDPSYWPPVDRQLTLTLDDLLVEDGAVAPFRRSGPTYTAMGRFGNVMLINGETEFSAEALVGEVVRLYVVNTANTRVFRFGVRGARIKHVGSDSGRYEHERFVDDVLLAPSERAVLDVFFDSPGEARLEHRTPDHVYALGSFSVSGERISTGAAAAFDRLRTDPELSAVRDEIDADFERAPDRTLRFWAEMPILYGDDGTKATTDTAYHACPMHAEIAASFAAACPKCGMKLVPSQPGQGTSLPFSCPMHDEIVASWPASCPLCGMTLIDAAGGASPAHEESRPHTHGHDREASIEWEDDMVDINRETDSTNMIWQLIDGDTGATNADISWKFKVGDKVKIRLVNEMGSDHPMPHPFHVHGAGRFLVLSRDGVVEPNLVWKDTVLVLSGETVDILLFVTSPGLWMAHCHIAEHNQSGMMFSFEVEPGDAPQSALQ